MRINKDFFLISAILTFGYKKVLPSAVELDDKGPVYVVVQSDMPSNLQMPS